MKELEQFTTDQLKVMVYDASQQAAVLRQQLEILNQEISRRQSQSPALAPSEEKTSVEEPKVKRIKKEKEVE